MGGLPYELTRYKLVIAEVPRLRNEVLFLDVPDDFLERTAVCGNVYHPSGLVEPVTKVVEDGQTVIYFEKFEEHSKERLIFTDSNTGIYILELFGWQPYQRYDGSFTITPQ